MNLRSLTSFCDAVKKNKSMPQKTSHMYEGVHR